MELSQADKKIPNIQEGDTIRKRLKITKAGTSLQNTDPDLELVLFSSKGEYRASIVSNGEVDPMAVSKQIERTVESARGFRKSLELALKGEFSESFRDFLTILGFRKFRCEGEIEVYRIG